MPPRLLYAWIAGLALLSALVAFRLAPRHAEVGGALSPPAPRISLVVEARPQVEAQLFPARGGCQLLQRTFKLSPQCGDNASELMVWPLLITGTGRAGTLFVRDELAARGFLVGHDNERVREHGAASWPLAIRETAPLDRAALDTHGYALPRFSRRALQKSFAGPAAAGRFRFVFHQVRDPVACIVSRASRIGMMDSPVSYSNPFLFRALGHAPSFPPMQDVELWRADRANGSWSVEKRLRVSLFHWVFWNEWVGSYADSTYRIEDVDVDVLVAKAGLRRSGRRKPPRRPKSRSNHHAVDADLAGVGWPDLCRVSAFMCDRAQQIAKSYGYAV
ncbi:hypothetical protein M885DRAFT_512621 [Pelagophyceae sp. CCMP2097]|nr:hypothetical protein M885DRAFT_512621 [Pelagophyceae sp. CCMP2097]|mmetsp:Transcript_23675/g.79879  ORF Transcript_23675/g.79879 Transcript_23675/m.79879 type:complete len:333 (-) Transcript_23675:46-1044(-)